MKSAASLPGLSPGLTPRLSVVKVESGHYIYEVSHAGQILYEGEGFSSITAALLHAIDSEPKFGGFEVVYDGYSVGTFTFEEIASDAEKVSGEAENTRGKFPS